MGTPGEGTRHAGLLYRARAIPNPKPEDRRPKETRRPSSELIATPAEQQPVGLGHSRNSDFGLLDTVAQGSIKRPYWAANDYCEGPFCRRRLRIDRSGGRVSKVDQSAAGIGGGQGSRGRSLSRAQIKAIGRRRDQRRRWHGLDRPDRRELPGRCRAGARACRLSLRQLPPTGYDGRD